MRTESNLRDISRKDTNSIFSVCIRLISAENAGLDTGRKIRVRSYSITNLG